MTKKIILVLLLLLFCFGPATVAVKSATKSKVELAIEKAKMRISTQKQQETTERKVIQNKQAEPEKAENAAEVKAESQKAQTEKTIVVTLEDEQEPSSVGSVNSSEQPNQESNNEVVAEQKLGDILVMIASAPLVVAEGGLQVVAAVIDGVRRRGKPSPAQRKKPTFLLDPDDLRTLDDFSKDWGEWEHAFGDFGGMRPWLDEQGLLIDVVYTSEFFSNLHGGMNTKGATEYRGNLDVTLTIDAEKFGLGPGKIGFAYAQLGHGEGITDDHVGDIQTLSNIDADEFSQISEYWLEQMFCEDQFRLKVGKQDSGADFCALDYGGDFIGSSFGVIPTVPLPTFPDPALGVALFWEPIDWFSFGAGVYDGAPKGGNSGFSTTFDGRNGTFSMCEMALKPTLGAEELPGTYRFGAWHHSDDFEEIGGSGGTNVFVDNYGLYLACDQTLYHEKPEDEEDGQGLGSFVQFGWAPENRNEIDRYFGVGLSYTGLFPNRDDDIMGLALARAYLSNRLDDVSEETVVELFYKAQLNQWMGIQPDLQYIVKPGGDGDDALAFGVRFEIVF